MTRRWFTLLALVGLCACTVTESMESDLGLSIAPSDSLTVNLSCPAVGTSRVFYVDGNNNHAGGEYETLHALFDTVAFNPNDLVCIKPHPGGGAWNEKFRVHYSSVTIRGIPDENGNLPVIDGANAVQWDTSYSNYNEAVIHVRGDSNGSHISGVVIENLVLQGGRKTDAIRSSIDGSILTYYGSSGSNPAAIHLHNADGTVIRNCEFSKTWIGIGGDETVAGDTVYEGNYFHDTDGGDTYTEGFDHAWYQFNRFGGCNPLVIATANITCSSSHQLKDRTQNPVIRYNVFEPTLDDGYSLDLVEATCSTNGTSQLTTGSSSQLSEVYGNVFMHSSLNPQHSIIHFGGDNCTNRLANADQTTFSMPHYRETLRLYNNTFAILNTANATTVLSLQWHNNPYSVLARNNIIYATDSAILQGVTLQKTNPSSGNSPAPTPTPFPTPPYELNSTFTHDWRSLHSNGTNSVSFGSALGASDPTEQQGSPGETPFLAQSIGSYRLNTVSNKIVGAALIDASWKQPLAQYLDHRKAQNRPTHDDLGAYDVATTNAARLGRGAFRESCNFMSICTAVAEAENYNGTYQGLGAFYPFYWTNASSTMFSGGAGMGTGAGYGTCSSNCIASAPSLDYQFYFGDTGTYALYVRAKSPTTSINTLYVYEHNFFGSGSGLSANDLHWPTTGINWSNTPTAGGSLTFNVATPGFYHFQFVMAQGGLSIDKIVFQKGHGAPTGNGPAESSQIAVVDDTSSNHVLNFTTHFYHINTARSGATWEFSPRFASYDGAADHAAVDPVSGLAWLSSFTTTSPAIDLQAKINNIGRHWIWVYARAPSSSSNLIHVGLDGQERESTASIVITGSGAYSYYRYAPTLTTTAYMDIETTGYHTVSVFAGKDGVQVDKVLLSTNPNFNPTGGYSDPQPE